MEKRKRKGFGAKTTWLLSLIFNRKPKYIFSEDLSKIDNAIIICNHNYERGPTKWSNHFKYDIVMWGNHTFCESKRKSGKALEDAMIRGGRSKFISKIVGFIAGPFIYFGFKHSGVIPVYRDMRMYITIQKSITEYENGHSVLIFPENSVHGFKYEIEEMMPGFLLFAKQLKERGHDPYIICAEQSPKSKMIILEKAQKLSELEQICKNDEEILEYCRLKINNIYPNYCKEHNIKMIKNKRKNVNI